MADDEYEITGGNPNCAHEWWHYGHADRCKHCPAVRTRK